MATKTVQHINIYGLLMVLYSCLSVDEESPGTPRLYLKYWEQWQGQGRINIETTTREARAAFCATVDYCGY